MTKKKIKKSILIPEHFNVHLNIKESNRGVSHFMNESLDSDKGEIRDIHSLFKSTVVSFTKRFSKEFFTSKCNLNSKI